MNTDYSHLLTEYPATISMDQLYKICHISKRKARWLLEHGVIPCEDNGNQTRRFAIKLTDVIIRFFLIYRFLLHLMFLIRLRKQKIHPLTLI